MNPQRPPHPIVQGAQQLKQLPITPHTQPIHHLMAHAVPIFHQLNALKAALGNAKATPKTNPNGIQGF